MIVGLVYTECHRHATEKARLIGQPDSEQAIHLGQSRCSNAAWRILLAAVGGGRQDRQLETFRVVGRAERHSPQSQRIRPVCIARHRPSKGGGEIGSEKQGRGHGARELRTLCRGNHRNGSPTDSA